MKTIIIFYPITSSTILVINLFLLVIQYAHLDLITSRVPTYFHILSNEFLIYQYVVPSQV